MTAPLSVFISYAREDEGALEKLTRQMSSLEKEGLITGWYDRMTTAGGDWELDIKGKLEAADIILLLVSADFIASDYCVSVEAAVAVERWKANKARVIPVILRAVDWKKFPLGSGTSQTSLGLLNALPRDGRPVKQWPDEDEAFLNVVAGLRAVIEEIRRARARVPPAASGARDRPIPTHPAAHVPSYGIGAARDPVRAALDRLMPFLENDSVTWFVGPHATSTSVESSLRSCDIARALLAQLELVDKDWTRLLPPVDVAASYYAAKRGMTSLLHDVTTWIANESQVPVLHQTLAQTLSRLRRKRAERQPTTPALRALRSNKQLIVTTNIDLMMERALAAACLPFTRIVQVQSEPRLEVTDYSGLAPLPTGGIALATQGASGEPVMKTADSAVTSEIDILLAAAPTRSITIDSATGAHTNNQNPLESLSIKDFAEPILYKLRGSVDVPESCAISAEQYLEFCLNIAGRFVPTQIGTIVQNTPAVFLGFGYLDPDFRLLYYTFLRALTELRKEDRTLYSVHARPFAETDDNYRWMELPIWDDLKDSGPRKAKITAIEASPEAFLREVAQSVDPAASPSQVQLSAASAAGLPNG